MSRCRASHPLANTAKWNAVVTPEVVEAFVQEFRTGERLRGSYSLNLVPYTPMASDRWIYWDRRSGIELLLNGRPAACVGYSCKRRELRIGQIQGVREAADVLRPLDWDAMLVELLWWVAAHFPQRYDAVAILPASKNRWYPKGNATASFDTEIRNFVQRMQKRYDKLAQRRGFTFVDPPGNYLRALPHAAALDGSLPDWLRIGA